MSFAFTDPKREKEEEEQKSDVSVPDSRRVHHCASVVFVLFRVESTVLLAFCLSRFLGIAKESETGSRAFALPYLYSYCDASTGFPEGKL